MKYQYEPKFLCFFLIYIVNITYNDKILLPFLIIEKKPRVSNTILLIHQFQLLTNIPFKNLNK